MIFISDVFICVVRLLSAYQLGVYTEGKTCTRCLPEAKDTYFMYSKTSRNELSSHYLEDQQSLCFG